MKSTLQHRFSNWIFHSYDVTPEGLALYRVFTGLFLIVFLLPSIDLYEFLGSLPSDFYNPPPGPMGLFQGFPPELLFISLHLLLILSIISMLLGFKTHIASLSTGVLFLIIKGFFYSVGKINHDLLIAVVPLVMAFSRWGGAYSLDAYLRGKKKFSPSVQSWPLVLLGLFIGFMMFTAGFPKILGGWLDTSTQATYGHYFRQFFLNNRQDLLAPIAQTVDNRILWELLDYGTVLFETGFLLAIIHPKSTRIFVCFAVLFHFSTMLLLNIAFLPNFIAYAAFINWPLLHRKSSDTFLAHHGLSVLLIPAYFILVGGAVLLSDVLGVPELNSDLRRVEFIVLLTALPIALYYLGKQGMIYGSDKAV